jgi:uncharacterized membrane protein
MRPEFWAILTAACWSVGSYFEKKGVALGQFHPVMGSTIRTVTSVLFLSVMILIMAIPAREQLYHAARNIGWKPILMIMIAGGICAGGIGIISLYQSLKGSLSIVLPIAFCLTPVLGVIIGVWFNKEILKPMQMVGVVLTIVGAAMTVYFKAHPTPMQPDSTKQAENRTTLSNA